MSCAVCPDLRETRRTATAPVDLLAVRPHPDDESSATGGILGKYGKLGWRTAVVCCTRGEEGEIRDPDLVYEEAFPRLGQIREQELRAACAVLNVAELHLLGYRDSGMAGTPSNQHPEAFCNADLDEAGARLARIIRRLRPRVVVTEQEGGSYGHPDHIQCHRVTMRAWELCADPAALPDALPPWRPERLYTMIHVFDGWDKVERMMKAEGLDTAFIERRREHASRSKRPEDATAAVDVRDFTHIQRQALLCHRTQVRPNSHWMQMPDHIRREAFSTAYLVRIYPAPQPGERETDLL